MKKIISTVLALSLIISTSLSIFANSIENIPPNSPENKTEVLNIDGENVKYTTSENGKEMAKINNVINKLDPYVKYNNATNEYFIDTKKLPKTITKSEIRIANRIISNTNQNNLIKSSAHNTVVKAKKKGGVTKLVLRWYGYDLYLSHRACNLLFKHHSLPIAIVGILHPAAAAEVIAWAYLIHKVDKGNGVIVKLVRGVPGTPLPVWVRRQ